MTSATIAKPAVPFRAVEIGRVRNVGSAMATITINNSIIRNNQLQLAQIGTILKIVTSKSLVVAMVGSLKIGSSDDEGLADTCLAQLNIMGEITTNETTRQTRFFRGVRSFPVLGEGVYNMSPDELTLIFNRENEPCIEIGRLQQDNSIVAKVRINDLLSKHFAIIGSTGSGKSCTVALVLQAILNQSPMGHVVLFDPHNEYSKSFGDKAEAIGQDSLDLPIWVFDFVETCELLCSDIEDQAREEVEILHDVILKAKRLYDRSVQNGTISTQVKIDDIESELQRATHISLDSPVPYRIRDVSKLLDHDMGKLENSNNLAPYMRLKRRIATLIADPRYQFAFRNQASPRPIEQIIGRIFRLPVQGKPISCLDFSGIPSEALNIVVSVVSRLAFELATWSERNLPILLVCEEAHRYIPRAKSLGFHSSRRIISAQFTDLWQRDLATPQMMETVFKRWRARSLHPDGKPQQPDVHMPTVQDTRATLRGRVPMQQSSARRAAPPQQQQQQPAAAPQPGALAAQVRERLLAKAAAEQQGGIASVKSRLNSAFHKNI